MSPSPTLQAMKSFSFVDRFGQEDLYKNQQEAWAELIEFMEDNVGNVILLDLRGISFLGYSFAKGTLVQTVKLINGGVLPNTRIVALVDRHLSLEELKAALVNTGEAMVIMNEDDTNVSEGDVIGAIPDHLASTWKTLARMGAATTAEVAHAIEESLQNTNQRLKKLDDRGLIRRTKVLSASGGWEWKNSVP